VKKYREKEDNITDAKFLISIKQTIDPV